MLVNDIFESMDECTKDAAHCVMTMGILSSFIACSAIMLICVNKVRVIREKENKYERENN